MHPTIATILSWASRAQWNEPRERGAGRGICRFAEETAGDLRTAASQKPRGKRRNSEKAVISHARADRPRRASFWRLSVLPPETFRSASRWLAWRRAGGGGFVGGGGSCASTIKICKRRSVSDYPKTPSLVSTITSWLARPSTFRRLDLWPRHLSERIAVVAAGWQAPDEAPRSEWTADRDQRIV